VRDDPDALVIGGGVVGLFCAYHLCRTGASVAVVERGLVGGPQSCSYGNTGFVGTQGAVPLAEPGVLAQGMRWLLSPESPFYIRPRADGELLRWLWNFRRACNETAAMAGFHVLVQMKQRSLDILREVCASNGLAPTLTARGMVLAFKTRDGFEKARRSVPWQVAAGVPLRVLSSEELRALEPQVELDVWGALYNEEGAFVHAPDFVIELARLVAAMGVDVYAETDVAGFEVANDVVRLVKTTRGAFRPREVVIAAGAWSSRLARQLGTGLLLQAGKGYSVTVKAPAGAPTRPLLLSEGKVAVTPLGGRLRFGGTLELAGMNAAVTQRRVDGILRTVRSYLPGVEATETMEVWSGLRPLSPDGLPFIGRAEPYRNVSIGTGHGHIGMGLAPVTGRLIAQIIAGEELDMDLAPLSVSRYGRRAGRL
jgi:D-amino-acid dehydrogenase